ncbi:uncharacterized protein LOC119386745 [Rhipicephalus sanguineus]|uniref:uncharacterized protein LOC119386745 n=1 Tax=Rhipicephalus sanguineus TaxID=34632 RepID=UPI00189301C4|nr:uncharacterized protein LOC119386745 [Rhipicephalus sanguineus]
MEPKKFALLVDKLRGNSFVKVLRFRNPRFSSGRTQEDICRLISSLPALEELECPTAWKCPVAFLDILSELLRTTTCLEALRIPMVCIKNHGAEGLLEALALNSTLKELSLDESFIGEASLSHRAGFANYLRKNTTLETLTVLACNKMQDSLMWILNGLLENHTITKVNLTNFVVGRQSSELIPLIFARNKTISSFNMISTRQDREAHDHTTNDDWLEALKRNQTLNAVRLPFCAFKLEQWESLFQALPTKASLKLTIEWNVTYYHLLPRVCSVLREAVAEQQVFFETNFPPNSADMLDYKGFSEIFASLRSDTRSEFSRIMHKLPSASHITSVQLEISMHTIDAALSTRIADYIRHSTTLKKLQLFLFCDPLYVPRSSCWADIVTSLSQNGSVKELHVKLPNIEVQDTGRLAHAVKSNKNMQRVYLVPERSRDASAFFKVLAEDVRENLTLLSVVVDVSLDDEEVARDWFVVWDAMRRNSGRLRHAALFVSGHRCDRACAEALEWMPLHPALPEQVAELSSVHESDAIVMIRDALKSLQDMHEFMRLAGVVSRRVSCQWREDERVQLSDLNEDCWGRVRGYLRLSDVGYSSAEP